MGSKSPDNRDYYQKEYARKYIERTGSSPYTLYKNQTLSKVARYIGACQVLDIGCNVNPIINKKGSLRFQMEQKGIKYVGMDISSQYFNKQLARDLGVAQSDIYEEVNGIVGDILDIPMKSSSIKLITCVDVLEHITGSDKAFKEISRVLSKDGRALIVLPSMYKLDIANYPHIKAKRKSSHESKLTASEWAKKWENAGLKIDYDKSRPLGVASGLSYLSWLSDDFVPKRKQLDGTETYSTEAELHKNAKRILSKYDGEIDKKIFSNPKTASDISSKLKAGKIRVVFKTLQNIVNIVEIRADEQRVLHDFFDSVLNIQFNNERTAQLKTIFNDQDNPLFLMGNSMLIVLKK